MNYIKNINLAVTSRCNLRCKICDIWQSKAIDFNTKMLDYFLDSKLIKKSYFYYNKKFDITLTGGEPFLRDDLIVMAKEIEKKFPDSLKTISTNGILKEKIINFIIKFGKPLSLHISLDGTRKNDLQRGCKGTYKKIIDTITTLKKKFPTQDIVIKFTISPYNYDEIVDTHHLSRKLGCRFHVKLVENALNYTNLINQNRKRFGFSPDQKKSIIKQLSILQNESKEKDKSQTEFIKDIILFLKGGKKIRNNCNTPHNSLFIMADGKVYSCILMNSIGNLRKQSLDEIWNSDMAKRNREYAREGCYCLNYHGAYANYLNSFTASATN